MSTRQQSFFDKDQKQKARAQLAWNRHANDIPRPFSVHTVTREAVVSGPPIKPSTQARKKLKAFQFIEGAPTVEDTAMEEEDKENRPIESNHNETPKIQRAKSDVISVGKKIADTLKLAQSTTCPPPSTPATRLPLADLVGNADDASRRAKPEISPHEQLEWRGMQSPRSSNPNATPAAGRKKRARSSSPIASSQLESATKEPFDLQQMQQSLKTPQADPVAEAWNRYHSNTGLKGTPAKKNVAFAHLMEGSSPHSSATAGSISGLRRWASCGVTFPESIPKRRKTRGGFRMDKEGDGDLFGVTSSEAAIHEPSKLESMIEKMRGTMNKPSQLAASSNVPSSSSPLPGDGNPQEDLLDSPLQHRSAGHPEMADDERHDSPRIEKDADANDDHSKRSFSSDEFVDADLDIDMVEAIESAEGTANLHICLTTETTNALEPIGQLQIPEPSPAVQPTNNEFQGSDDEFGIGDEDLLAADMEHVASLYDNRPDMTPAAVQSQVGDTVLSPPRKAPVINLCDDDSSDEFGGDDIDIEQFTAAEAVATRQSLAASQLHSNPNSKAIQRYLITRVDQGMYDNGRGHKLPEKVLLVEDEKTKLFKAITLRQAWYNTPCTPRSFVHVIGDFSSTGQCLVDDANNMLILHPDHLISSTVVADSFNCLRRAVLQDRVKATSKANAPMLYGTLLHELFQEAMKANRWDSTWLFETIDKLLPSKFETILEIGYTCEFVRDHLKSKLPELQAWAEIFIRSNPRDDAIVRECNGKQSIMSITKLLDVEEHVWSPQYGLKGNIDATVQVVMKDDVGERVLTVPFEVKTGKNSSNASHVAQTALYNLLLSNRYDVDVAYGILYYLETSDITRVPAIRKDVIHMIIKRNELACYVRDRIELPPMLKQDFKCQKCYAQEPCFLYNRLVEDQNGETLNSKAKEKYDELVRNLKPSDKEFMKKWDSLLTKEETDMMKFRRELWTMLSTEREKLGRCFSNVILEPGSASEQKEVSKINRYSYTFIKQKQKAGFSFTESQLIVGEPIVVSDEQGHFALANGYVTRVRKRRITVAVDRRLHNARTKLPGFDSQTNQTFAGIMEVSKDDNEVSTSQHADSGQVVYRLDKDEFSNGMAVPRNNLIQIMDDNVFKARELRSLIVNEDAPHFNPRPGTCFFPSSLTETAMNPDQKRAVEQVMAAEDYALVLGMPGTGKTTTIAHIIRSLVAKGKSVLLTSYTHTAVDNILSKIRNDGIGILRLGASAKVHPDVKDFATLAVDPKQSLEELEKSWMEPPVVATTCLAIGHPLFNQRTFDYCIVDEASQITLPVCLGPIRMAKTFILVGDHHQLPPLVQNKEAAADGLDVSLFMLLCERHPQAVVSLEHQYRMCADIMLLSNTFIYSGRLKCGTEAVANRKLAMPDFSALAKYHRRNSVVPEPTQSPAICPGLSSERCWLTRALDPSATVLFLNTDNISTSLETAAGSRITNAFESRIITNLTSALLTVGISASDVGVIAFYRSQLALLRSSLQHAHTQTQSTDHAGAQSGAVELHTADKFQGRDKEVILVSCVRSNENGVVGDLLKDRRRINVALTRARSKLIIVGSVKTLSKNDLLRELIELCEQQGWTFNLEADNVDGHLFEEGWTQTGRTPASAKRRSVFGDASQASPSPTKRKALGDVTTGGHANVGKNKSNKPSLKTPSSSPEFVRTGRRSPQKVFRAGKKALLDTRPIMRDVFNDAM